MCAKSHTAALEAGASAAFGLLGFSSRRGWVQYENLDSAPEKAGYSPVSAAKMLPATAEGSFLSAAHVFLPTPSTTSSTQRFVKEFTSNEPNANLTALTSVQYQVAQSSNSISLRDDNNRVCVSCCARSRHIN